MGTLAPLHGLVCGPCVRWVALLLLRGFAVVGGGYGGLLVVCWQTAMPGTMSTLSTALATFLSEEDKRKCHVVDIEASALSQVGGNAVKHEGDFIGEVCVGVRTLLAKTREPLQRWFVPDPPARFARGRLVRPLHVLVPLAPFPPLP